MGRFAMGEQTVKPEPHPAGGIGRVRDRFRRSELNVNAE